MLKKLSAFLQSLNSKSTIDMQQLQIANITIDVVRKDIKNVHLRVYPPPGSVRISAPRRMDLDTIRVFAVSKLNWIKKQQTKLRNQEREAPRDYLNKESHYFKGKRYLLKVVEQNLAPRVVLKHTTIELYIRPGTCRDRKKSILDEWYRQQLKELLPALIQKWEKKMGVQVNEVRIKKMKTRWGTCNREKKRIWLNLDLAKKPVKCLEFIVVHEMVHLFERKHNDRFVSYMDKFMPRWKFNNEVLNRTQVCHEQWSY
jgi:predicted metal-dependent hydrolase